MPEPTKNKEIKGIMRYEQDSKRFHRCQIEAAAGIVGIVYIPKGITPWPKRLTLTYEGKED